MEEVQGEAPVQGEEAAPWGCCSETQMDTHTSPMFLEAWEEGGGGKQEGGKVCGGAFQGGGRSPEGVGWEEGKPHTGLVIAACKRVK